MFHNSLRCSRMIQTISEHSTTFQNIPECSRVLWNVLKFSQMGFFKVKNIINNDLGCFRMFQTIHEQITTFPKCSIMLSNALDYTDDMFWNILEIFQPIQKWLSSLSQSQHSRVFWHVPQVSFTNVTDYSRTFNSIPENPGMF